ncbi:hypothetical protein [Cellulomonas sp. S1-8]|uniref:hypothetical protein n=1 Tax=Cellulomonas sp. S1-8 TaxID=2904790 RepID=UPI002243CAF5|nr:hypothetical protein [Cellulomonas sp. S1-8]UZN02816.1 hypothetical protein OKX07_17445 [Cellulomonas sp. S1-8]
MTSTPTAPARGRTAARVAVVAALSAACWFAWMGWDTEYQTDPGTGAVTGPYEAWQVVGCLVSLVLVTVLAVRMLGRWRTVVTVAVAFTAAWSLTQAPTDSSGLWVVGALLVLAGTAAGAGVVAVVAAAVRRRRGRAAGVQAP